jgi:hypothetical protein
MHNPASSSTRLQEIQGITQDMQSIATTMDGKFLLIITAGFQRFGSGLFGARAARPAVGGRRGRGWRACGCQLWGLCVPSAPSLGQCQQCMLATAPYPTPPHPTPPHHTPVLDIETDEPLGFIPAAGGHHDLAVVPRTVKDMIYTRAICM